MKLLAVIPIVAIGQFVGPQNIRDQLSFGQSLNQAKESLSLEEKREAREKRIREKQKPFELTWELRNGKYKDIRTPSQLCQFAPEAKAAKEKWIRCGTVPSPRCQPFCPSFFWNENRHSMESWFLFVYGDNLGIRTLRERCLWGPNCHCVDAVDFADFVELFLHVFLHRRSISGFG